MTIGTTIAWLRRTLYGTVYVFLYKRSPVYDTTYFPRDRVS